jgi:hypothetical protein
MGLGSDVNTVYRQEIEEAKAQQAEQAELRARQRELERKAALLALRGESLVYLEQFPAETVADEQYRRQLLNEYFQANSIGGTVGARAALLDYVLGPMALNPQDDPAFEMMGQIGRYGEDIEGIAIFAIEVSMGAGSVEAAGPLARAAEGYLARSAIGRTIRAQIQKMSAARAEDPWALQRGFARISWGPRTAVDAADEALAAGKTRGAASQLDVGGQRFTDVSGAKPGLHARVQEALDRVPPAERAPWHGHCAEVGCVDQAFKTGVDPRGGTSIAVNIGRSGSGHGTFKEACSSCRRMLEFLGVRF